MSFQGLFLHREQRVKVMGQVFINENPMAKMKIILKNTR